MTTIAIIGASQGLGLEFARQYAQDPNNQIIATCRDEQAKQRLEELGKQVSVRTLDVRQIEAIEQFAASLKGQPIDIAIINAGVYGEDLTFGQASTDQWIDVLRINTIAPVMLAFALMPNLVAGRDKKLVALTSQMGSIDDNKSGGHIPYRTSKAALNMAFKSLSIDHAKQGIIAAVIHPGWVKTRMGGKLAPLEATDSVSGMRKVIAKLGKEQSGAFLRYDGTQIAW